MAFVAAALPWIIGGLTAVNAATTIIAATKTPQAPAAPAPITTSTANDKKAQTATAYANVDMLKKRKGTASTILTGPLGTTDTAQTKSAQLGG